MDNAAANFTSRAAILENETKQVIHVEKPDAARAISRRAQDCIKLVSGSWSLGAAERQYMESREGNWISVSRDLPRNNLVNKKLYELLAVKVPTGLLPIVTKHSDQPISLWIKDRPQFVTDPLLQSQP
ncbi:hypothetical protein HFO49_03445 [Rhizobium leguminosarum]|uniref:hypothetical protein n=1 Tax=Rhizobium leguminosarum TaxID=384 RepID=UPI001C97D001|nr:hypothetical protein [Rhizobium leguminosarum]MBY5586543.1 hypothetical protein [Rhizobium leguminosarum]